VPDEEGVVYRVDGPPGAPVLVMVGSLGTTGEVWDGQVPVLRQWLRALRVEHPGHGGAAVPAGRGSLEALGERLVRLLDTLQVPRASFAGLSLGGQICMWVAVHHPDRVDHLVISCSVPRFGSPRTYAERAVAVRERGTQHLVDGAISRWFTDQLPISQPGTPAKYREMLAAVDPEGYAYCCEAVAGADLSGDVSRLTAPTLLVGGGSDPVVTPDMLASFATQVKGAMLCILPGAAHLANVEQPGAFNDVLVNHLLGSAATRGRKVREAVLGAEHVARALGEATELTADFQDLLTRWPWGDIWARPGLDVATRRLLTIALLVALNRPEELEMHIRGALESGVTQGELKEVLMHTAVYAGIPAANSAFAIAGRVAREHGRPGT